MYRLMFVIHAMSMTVLMGIFVTAVLTMGLPGWKPVVLAAAAGFLLSIPVSWWAAREIVRRSPDHAAE